MEKICGVYSIMNLVNNKRYIGQSVDVYVRWGNHKSALRNNRHGNKHLQNAWNTYGEDNFNFEVLSVCDIDTIDKIEQYYIKLFDTINPEFGYNKESGGHENKYLSIESRNIISKKRKGKRLTDDHKLKISKSGQGRKFSEETKNKISNALTGIKRSDETREKISESRTGKKSWSNKSIYCIELDEVFYSIKEAELKYGFNSSSIISHLKGRYSYSGKHPETGDKLHWTYCEDIKITE